MKAFVAATTFCFFLLITETDGTLHRQGVWYMAAERIRAQQDLSAKAAALSENCCALNRWMMYPYPAQCLSVFLCNLQSASSQGLAFLHQMFKMLCQYIFM